MIFLFYFIKILKLSIEQGNKVLEDKKFLEFLDKRLTQIKMMKSLYLEDPIKIMDKIESLDEIFKNKNKEDAKDKNNNVTDTDNNNKNFLKEDDKGTDNPQKLTLNSNNQAFKSIFKDEFKGLYYIILYFN